MASLVIPVHNAHSFFVDAFLQRYPVIAGRAGGYRYTHRRVWPKLFFECDRDDPTPEQVTRPFAPRWMLPSR
jgi:hypothetical protein